MNTLYAAEAQTLAVRLLQQTLDGLPVAVEPLSLRVLDATDIEIVTIGSRLMEMHRAATLQMNFSVGDWYNALTARYGAKRQAVEEAFDDGRYQHIRNCGNTARRWPARLRMDSLPWTFYRATSARWLSEAERLEYVRRWRAGGLTCDMIREEVRSKKPKDGNCEVKEEYSLAVTEQHCNPRITMLPLLEETDDADETSVALASEKPLPSCLSASRVGYDRVRDLVCVHIADTRIPPIWLTLDQLEAAGVFAVPDKDTPPDAEEETLTLPLSPDEDLKLCRLCKAHGLSREEMLRGLIQQARVPTTARPFSTADLEPVAPSDIRPGDIVTQGDRRRLILFETRDELYYRWMDTQTEGHGSRVTFAGHYRVVFPESGVAA